MNQILKLEDVWKTFESQKSKVHALRGVSLNVDTGTTFGLVGESGSGKSTLARCALGLIPMTSGSSVIDGIDISTLSRKMTKKLRSTTGMVFQNPIAALNPRMTVQASIEEPLRTHTRLSSGQRGQRVRQLLDEVGLASSHAERFPHQLSGGQCQRVGIARAIALEPSLLILDEPTSALDVSVQAQVLNLLQELRQQRSLTYLMISHDLDVIRYMSDRVGVMYKGELVEVGDTEQVLSAPENEYTKSLIASTPSPITSHVR